MAREYFCAYHSYLKSIEPLNDAERGRLFTALLEYSSAGIEAEPRGNERFIFPMMKEQIDRDTEKYNAFCEKQAQNIRKRWDSTVYGGMSGIPDDTKHTKTKEKEKEKERNTPSECKESAARPRTFTKPTVAEVAAYCTERNNGVDAQQFSDFYTAKGWRVGNQPMKDWRAAVRTWERRETSQTATPKRRTGTAYRQHTFESSDLDALLTDLDTDPDARGEKHDD